LLRGERRASQKGRKTSPEKVKKKKKKYSGIKYPIQQRGGSVHEQGEQSLGDSANTITSIPRSIVAGRREAKKDDPNETD